MRYEECPSHIYEKFNEIIEEYFPSYVNLNFVLLFDEKKRKSQGEYVVAQIQKPSELLKFFTSNSSYSEGADYVIVFDKKVFENANETDIERIIRHELQHVEYISDSDNPCKIRGHEVEDFYEEIKRNEDDPKWKERIVAIAESLHESENS